MTDVVGGQGVPPRVLAPATRSDRPCDQPGTRLTGRFWPTTSGEPPRLPDGSVDVRALCRRWDDEANQ